MSANHTPGLRKPFEFPATTERVSAGAWVASKTRKLQAGRFEAVAALFASDPTTGHKTGIRCAMLYAIAGSRRTAETRATNALGSSRARQAAMAAGHVSESAAEAIGSA